MRSAEMLRIHLAQIHFNPAYYDPPTDFLEEPAFVDINDTGIGNLREIPEIENFLVNSRESYMEHLQKRLAEIVTWSGERRANLIMFPEYSVPCVLLPSLRELAIKHGMIIVAGSHRVKSDERDKKIYQRLDIVPQTAPVGSACVPILLPDGSVKIVKKSKQSRWEPNLVVSDSEPLIIETKWNGKALTFAVVPCIDSLHLNVVGKVWEKGNVSPGLVLCPSLSPSVALFENAGSLVRLKEVLFGYANAAVYGGTFFNIPSYWDPFLRGPKYGAQNLPKGVEAILEIEFDSEVFFLKRGSVNASLLCTHPVSYPIVYKKEARWLSKFDKIRKFVLNFLESNKADNAKELLSKYLADHAAKLPDLVMKNIKDLRHSLIPLYEGDISVIQKATELVRVGENVEDPAVFNAKRVHSAIKALTGQLVAVTSDSHTAMLLKCLECLKKHQRALPSVEAIDISDETRIVAGLSEALEFTGEQDLVESFQNRGTDLDIVRNFFANRDNRVIIVTGSLGIGKTGFMDWMFRKAFADWDTIRIHVPPEVRFPRTFADIAYNLGQHIDADSIGSVSHKIFRKIARKVLAIFFSVPKRTLIIDDLYQIFKQRNARDYRLLSIFFEEAAAPSKYIGGRVFLVSSSWVPDNWLHTARVSHLHHKGLRDIYVRRIIEYQMRRMNLVNGEVVPEPPQALLDLINGHPLSAKLVVEALRGKNLSELSNELSLSRITRHVATELLKRAEMSVDEQRIMVKLSVFRLPPNLSLLNKIEELDLDGSKLLALANRCVISYDGESVQMHEAIRRFFYSQMSEAEVTQFHSLAAHYYQKVYEKQRASRILLNPSVVGELAHHLAMCGELARIRDLKLFVVEEIKPAARKIYREQRSYDKALSLYEIASQVVPDDPEVWAYIGRCYARLGQWNDSDSNFNKAIEVARKAGLIPWWIYRDWGHIRARFQFYSIAEDMFAKASSWKPYDPSINASLAYMRWHQGKHSEARKLFEEALRVNPNHEYTLTYYSKMLDGLGEGDYADELREKLASLDPSLRYQEPEEYDIEVEDLEYMDYDDMA